MWMTGHGPCSCRRSATQMATRKRRYPPNNVQARRKPCIDCIDEGVTTGRKAPHPGPRCATHHRARRSSRRDLTWERRIELTYNITSEQYWAIYEAQGGKCAICRRATGAKRRLSVDHDHSCCSGPTSCGRCVRSLLCSTCNKMLGHIRDSTETAERILHYLHSPPGKEVLATWGTAQYRDAIDPDDT